MDKLKYLIAILGGLVATALKLYAPIFIAVMVVLVFDFITGIIDANMSGEIGKTPPSIIENTFKAEWLDKIIVPAGNRNAHKNATNWSKFADYIVEGVIA